ncbi:MAG: MarR family transcriptional regulator [Ignavibacteriales bacterium]|nr:MarR family transcriptional regulator [Ignavibacteriales bacterium]
MIDEKTQSALNLWEHIIGSYENLKRAQVKTIFENKLTIPQYSLLEVLYTKGSMPLKKIAEKLFVSGANITCVVDNLEKEDFVKRVPSNIDRRVIMAELTSKGEEKIAKLFPVNAKNISEITKRLTSEEFVILEKLLRKLEKENNND